MRFPITTDLGGICKCISKHYSKDGLQNLSGGGSSQTLATGIIEIYEINDSDTDTQSRRTTY